MKLFEISRTTNQIQKCWHVDFIRGEMELLSSFNQMEKYTIQSPRGKVTVLVWMSTIPEDAYKIFTSSELPLFWEVWSS